MWDERYTISSFRDVRRSREFLLERRNPITGGVPLEIYMLLTGYLTIVHYDEDKDVCVLSYANSETENAICDGFRSYLPSEKKSFVEVEGLTNNLRTLMIDANISKVVEFLNRVGFPKYHIALKEVVDEQEVTRRLIAILRTANLLSEETQEFFFGNILSGKRSTEGDIDITTRDLPINYVIEVKCGTGKKSSVMDGIMQQVEYATKTEEKRISFLEALGSDNRVYLLTLHFKETYGGTIDEWVFIPFTATVLRFDEMEASSEKLLNKVKDMSSSMNIDAKYIIY